MPDDMVTSRTPLQQFARIADAVRIVLGALHSGQAFLKALFINYSKGSSPMLYANRNNVHVLSMCLLSPVSLLRLFRIQS